MDHNNCRENLSAYLDGELPPVERAAVDAHLAGCPDCRAVLDQLGGVSRLVKAQGLEPVPPYLKGAVLAGPKKAAYPWLKPVLALSAAAAGVLVVMNLTNVPEPGSFSLGYNARSSADFGAAEAKLETEAGSTLPPEEPAAPAPATPAARVSGGERKYSSVASVRGAYSQAKFSARATAPMGALAGGAGSSLEMSPAMEYRGPVCVQVYRPSSPAETDAAMYKARTFLEKTGVRVATAGPGRLVFVKNGGGRVTLTEKDCSYGFIFFDGTRDPLIVPDPASVPAEYAKYFGSPAP
ncbi:MAG: hypothetical protein A2X32_01885 [Elusimicrobia bacterium GWC2_64_44]|nr:MAG: hypothetical protein A2X32_01885 [Elusimicrobia bacterium GWC2_64_44]